MKKRNLILTTLLFSGVFACGLGFAQLLPSGPVKVTAWGQHYGGQVVYRYQVQNLGKTPIRRFHIGHYPSVIDGRAELTVSPKTVGPSFWLASDGTRSPEGWGVMVDYPEESATFSLEWIDGAYFRELWSKAPYTPETPAIKKDNGIPAGATWDNFSVTVSKPDFGYVTGHASIHSDDYINVPLIKGDSVPPTINLTVNRVNQNEGNGTWAIFNVQASATDNYDPAPTLVFAPISANQVLQAGDVVTAGGNNAWNIKLKNIPGRTYQLKFTSIDASGNTTVKTYDYAVVGKK